MLTGNGKNYHHLKLRLKFLDNSTINDPLRKPVINFDHSKNESLQVLGSLVMKNLTNRSGMLDRRAISTKKASF